MRPPQCVILPTRSNTPTTSVITAHCNIARHAKSGAEPIHQLVCEVVSGGRAANPIPDGPSHLDSTVHIHFEIEFFQTIRRQSSLMKIGYARVSTEEQNLALQRDALMRAGCKRIFTDRGVSGTEFDRPGLNRALASLRAGDTLVVWRLDRLGRALPKLVGLVQQLSLREIQFESLTEAMTTNSSSGMLVFHMMAALAQFERSLISERTCAGMAAARARGQILGRRPALNEKQRAQALKLLLTQPIKCVAKQFNVHPRTLQRLQKAHQATAGALRPNSIFPK